MCDEALSPSLSFWSRGYFGGLDADIIVEKVQAMNQRYHGGQKMRRSGGNGWKVKADTDDGIGLRVNMRRLMGEG